MSFSKTNAAQWSPSQLWSTTLGQLEVEIPRPNFETWLRQTSAFSLEKNILTVETPSTFVSEMLEHRLSNTIERTLKRVTNVAITVKFRVQSESSSPKKILLVNDKVVDSVDTTGENRIKRSTKKNKEYTFENFLSGPSNQLAHAAALQVADSSGTAFNPLYIYSDVGLGKTHLLWSISHRFYLKGMNVKCISAERFTNEYILSIRENATEDFRRHYRNLDALLIDDIQFVSTKPQTQEGFFHTFNELHMFGRQIIVAGDKPADRIKLEERIQSRLSGGLVVDIQPPDYELKYAILSHKLDKIRINVPHAVLDAIATKSGGNIRDLEGALNRILAFAHLTGEPINIALAERALSNIRNKKPIIPGTAAVLAAVEAHTGVPPEVITGKRRDRRTAAARRLAAYILREDTKLPITQIGQALGGKDHSTILYACRKLSTQLPNDSNLRQTLSEIRKTLRLI